ncbi:MAG: V-type proton ATPase subunit E [Candidatus Omnitrophica bacterium]|nr:V-type proton ATPase subunit E [Candidatus Omnitrophota bacterium]
MDTINIETTGENNNVEKILGGIIKQAEIKEKEILQKAKEAAESIISQAQKHAEKFERDENKKCEDDINRLKERISSTETMEAKKAVLIQRGIFMQKVFDKIKESVSVFRNSGEYKDFLKKFIKEGIDVIDKEKIEVLYSHADEKIFQPSFILEIEEYCNKETGKRSVIDFKKENFSDIGVIIRSSDKKIIYDNRFFTKFNRMKESLQREIIKEVSKNA